MFKIKHFDTLRVSQKLKYMYLSDRIYLKLALLQVLSGFWRDGESWGGEARLGGEQEADTTECRVEQS